MPDAKTIVNLGLGKIGSSRVNSLTPPRSVLEGLSAAGWTHWKFSELRKRRWVFATTKLALTPSGASPIAGEYRNYQYAIPADCLRPIRPRQCQWEIRGPFIYSVEAKLSLEYIRGVADSELIDVSFVEVLAWRVAMELAEPSTQSTQKHNDAVAGYRDAIAEAGKMNAFLLEPFETDAPDDQFSWVDGRFRQDG
jgi:hypothetical protein